LADLFSLFPFFFQFLDCEGSFICERVVEIAKAACRHIQQTAENESEAGTW